MGRGRVTRRQVLRAVTGIGLGVGGAGCSGSGSTRTSESTTRSTTTTARQPTTGTGQSPSTTGTPGTATARNQPRGTTEVDTNATTSANGTPSDASERGDYTVGMYTDLYFDPIGLFVEPGETVSFELESGVHSATAYADPNQYALTRRIPPNAPAWNTGEFGTVGAFRNVTFETEGTHDYYCIPHKQLGMVGRIVVGDPGGPASESPNPDAELPSSERIVEAGSIPYDAFADQ